ncbi:hypothetical protein FRB98_009106 [Tulasnella sp. 332]|nr:hypothetical protein FRB98_009106 [Tulasnella sp. 332]
MRLAVSYHSTRTAIRAWYQNLPEMNTQAYLNAGNRNAHTSGAVSVVLDSQVAWPLNPILLPTSLAGASIVLLLLQHVLGRLKLKRRHHHPKPDKVASSQTIVESQDGYVAYIFNFARLVLCLALSGTSAYAFWTKWSSLAGVELRLSFGTLAAEEIAQLGFYFYTSILALVTLTARPTVAELASTHLGLLLFVAFAVVAYRDLAPLGTFTMTPEDGGWVRATLLTIAGVIIPISTPRKYKPIDPSKRSPPNPEQTASYLSFALMSFQDPFIFRAYREPVSTDELPVLADYDATDNLVAMSFPTLDPSVSENAGRRPRHLFFGLMWVYRWEYTKIAFWLVLKSLTGYLNPLAVNNLLSYLEVGTDQGVFIRPWEQHVFTSSRLLVRTEAIITELVFERALKLRFTDETADKTDEDNDEEDVGSDDDASTIVPRPAHPRGETIPQGNQVSSMVESDRKGKGKAPSPEGPASRPALAAQVKISKPGSNLIGRLTNLVSTDLKNITDGEFDHATPEDFMMFSGAGPLRILLGLWFLYTLFSWAAFVGLFVMIISLPIPGKVASLIYGWQTDARVQIVTETMNVIRMIKLFGWEKKAETQIDTKRQEELELVKQKRLWGLINSNLNYILPMLVSIAVFSVYTLVMKRELTASRIFSSLTVLNMMPGSLSMTFMALPKIISGKVSIDRVDAFLREMNLLDCFANPLDEINNHSLPPNASAETISIKNASFSWKTIGTASSKRRNFRLRIHGDLIFEMGKLNLIIGSTGSGKTSLLMALLGEMHFTKGGTDSFYHLPREVGVAFCAQEPWIQSASFKENILFGATLNDTRYKKVLSQCALEDDLSLFAAGDATEVGEKGLTLSGGQKARLALARALYSYAQIVILDDILSALDVHTSRWIVDKCLCGDLLQGRTVLLVTHNVALTAPIAGLVVVVGSDGSVTSLRSVAEALSRDPALHAELAELQDDAQAKAPTVDNSAQTSVVEDKKPSGQLIAKETIAKGRIGWGPFTFFFATYGGILFWVAYAATMALGQLLRAVQVWFLGYWASQYDDHAPSEMNAVFYLTSYSMIIASGALMWTIASVIFVFGSVKGSRRIHERLTQAILNTNLRWLDSTPVGRIVSRFTQDIQSVDASVGTRFSSLVELSMIMLFRLASIIMYSPVFFFPGAVIAYVGSWVTKVYMAGQLLVKREMSVARSPVYSHFHACIAGLTSIRAYGVEEAFQRESRRRIDVYTRAARTFYNLNRWVSIRIETLSSLFVGSLTAYLVYVRKADASVTGFSLSMAVGFCDTLICFNLTTSLPTERGKAPACWPSSGSIHVEVLSAKYSADGPEVLHHLSFEINSGETIGVVGRAGAGKSSLSLALLRMINTSGKGYYDGIDTAALNLDALRSNITIIPQQPELMNGTIRQNLDPFGEHDDAILHARLRSSGLQGLQSDEDKNKIGLDTNVSSGGANFSLGQRQIIALARAMVRRSKVYILDEATASVDYKIDTAIQDAIASEFEDTTLIIVAHRLHTIMSADKILVLDAGRMVEFDSPRALLKKESAFKALVDGSGDHKVLLNLLEEHSGNK